MVFHLIRFAASFLKCQIYNASTLYGTVTSYNYVIDKVSHHAPCITDTNFTFKLLFHFLKIYFAHF